MSLPTILIVPGLWEGPSAFEPLAAVLRKAGYTVHTASLVSCGTVSPGNPSMKDDVHGIRKQLQSLVDTGDDVVLVLHSAGGFLGSEAMDGLDKSTRAAESKAGGVVKIIFLAAAVLPRGYEHQALPFAEEKVEHILCNEADVKTNSK